MTEVRNEILKLTKIEVVKRQLDCAIELYFHDGDDVSIHTLGSAAFEILRTLAKKKFGNCDTTHGKILEAGKRLGLKKIVADALSKPKNFFKHASSDPNATLEFRVPINLFILYEASQLYEKLTEEKPKIYEVFRAWVFCQFPEIIKDHKAAFSIAEAYRGYSRTQFKQEYIHLRSLIGSDKQYSHRG